MTPKEKYEFGKISNAEDLKQYLWDKYSLPHNMVFVQGLLLESKVERLYWKFVEFAKSRKNEPVTFFERHTPIKGKFKKSRYTIFTCLMFVPHTM